MGLTQQMPLEDRLMATKGFTEAQIAILMGGRVAEEIKLGDLSSGAKQDIQNATELARRMVCEWGMSDRIGPLHYGQKENAIFLDRGIAQHRKFSAFMGSIIDKEVYKTVITQYKRSRVLVESNLAALNGLAEKLLEIEVLSGEEIDAILNEHKAVAES
jgi:cell division protease FtsH